MPGKDARIGAPAGLELAGKRVWKQVVDHYALRQDELIVLESAARTADTISKLDEAMAGQPLVVTGSMGQQREHPLISELRQQRALLARLMNQLRLPDDDAVPVSPHIREQAQHAANTRWRRT